MLKKRFFKTKPEVEVTFEIEAPGSTDAALVIDLTGWESIPMTRRANDGPFAVKVRLPEDESIEFRYLLDGETWENDWAADGYVPNPYGSDNSVVVTSP